MESESLKPKINEKYTKNNGENPRGNIIFGKLIFGFRLSVMVTIVTST